MTLNQRNIVYVINVIILISAVGLIGVPKSLYSSTEAEKDVEDSKHYYGPGDNKQGYD